MNVMAAKQQLVLRNQLHTPVTRRLQLFLIGSIILHGASLAIWRSPAWFGGYPETVLSVNLIAPDAGARETHVEPRAYAPAGGSQTPDPIGAADHRDASAPSTPPVAASAAESSSDSSATSAASAASGVGGLEQARARIQASLRAMLARYFEYPFLARQRGWEGQVLLAFHVTGDGHLQALRVARSSGFAVLDASALHSLGRVERLDEAQAWLNGFGMDMQLPVIYRLVEN